MKAYIVEKMDLQENIRILLEKAQDTPIYGVIKGNGYGLGLLELASALKEGGVDRFAVTDVRDVVTLRENGFQDEILMLEGTCLKEELEVLLTQGAVATVGSLECAKAMAQVAEEMGKKFPCHLKIDTGMGRFGFLPEDADAIDQVMSMEHLDIRGIYTHFHTAFASEEATKAQFAAFQTVCDRLSEQGHSLTRHCCNSSAFLKYPEMHLDAVRLGSAILGRLSFPGDLGLKKIGWCEAPVELVRTLPKGHTVGYGAAWKAKRETTIAICGVGYFHGFGAEKGNDLFRFRDCVRGGLGYVKAFLQKKAIYGKVNGKSARVLGHIGMVGTVMDVTGLDVQPGDIVRLEINPLLQKGLEILYR